MRLAVALVIITIAACAMLAAHQRKPFPLFDEPDAKPAVWPAQARQRMMFVCKPAVFTLGPDAPKPISRT